PISRRDLWLIVHQLGAEGVTGVVSTAYLDDAERFDRGALLHRGRIVALDAPEALARAEAGTLLGVETHRPREARAVLAALPGVRRVTLFGDRLHVTVGDVDAAAPVIRRALAAAGLAARGPVPADASLEDVFIARLDAEAA